MLVRVGRLMSRGAGAGSAASGAEDLLGSETQGLALDFTDDYFFATTSQYGSAKIIDTSTPANDYDSHPYGKLTYTSPSAKMTLGPSGTLRFGAHNLCLHSENFTNAAWINSNTTDSANTTTAPDGTTTADSLLETTANNTHQLEQGFTLVAGASYSYTIYVKGINRTRAVLEIRDTALGSGIFAVADIDGVQQGVAPATYGSGYSTTGSTLTVTAAANGFVKCTLTFVAKQAATSIVIGPDSGAGTAAAANSYVGNTSNGLYLWGAQLTRTPCDTTYLSTTSSARYALPYEWNTSGVLQGILVEESRTNLATQSQSFASPWSTVLSGTAITANAVTSPDGTTNAATFTEGSNTNFHGVFQTHTLSGSHVFSCYMKAGERTWGRLSYDGGGGKIAWFNLSSGAIGTVNAGLTASIVAMGNGWYRCAIAFTGSGGSAAIAVGPATGDNGSESYSGDGTSRIYLWGAQLEAGSFATSYIPTIGSTVTRAADDISLATSAFPKSNSAGTLFCQVVPFATNAVAAVDRTYVNLSTPASLNWSVWLDVLGRLAYYSTSFQGGPSTSTLSVGSTTKMAGAWAASDMALSKNGATVATSTSFSPDTTNSTTLKIGHGGTGSIGQGVAGAYIAKVMYLPRRMANADLQALTQ